ncbi:MAG: hypothetical protein VZR53_13810 [Prevotella sp.]|nr:hypothetical protein [Prevotella sp.]
MKRFNEMKIGTLFYSSDKHLFYKVDEEHTRCVQNDMLCRYPDIMYGKVVSV